jgi:hypothetical protein
MRAFLLRGVFIDRVLAKGRVNRSMRYRPSCEGVRELPLVAFAAITPLLADVHGDFFLGEDGPNWIEV